jgi:hypothetical protein
VGEADYGGALRAIARDNIFATQFHPEKSADQGLGALPQLPSLESLTPFVRVGRRFLFPIPHHAAHSRH